MNTIPYWSSTVVDMAEFLGAYLIIKYHHERRSKNKRKNLKKKKKKRSATTEVHHDDSTLADEIGGWDTQPG